MYPLASRRQLGAIGQSGGGETWQTVTAPDAAFSFLPFTISESGGVFRIDDTWTIDADRPTGKAYYVSTTGSDAAAGTTVGAPLRSIKKALEKVDVDVVYVAAGAYGRQGFENVSPTRNVSIIATGGRAQVGYFQDDLVWVQEASPNEHVYKTTRSGATALLDAAILDVNGDYTPLTNRGSIEDVEANAGSWFLSGTSLYVRTADDRVPTVSIRVRFATGNGGVCAGAVTIYCENIDFEGGVAAFYLNASDSTHAPVGYFNNCTFKYSISSNCFSGLGATAYFKDCVFAKGYTDGNNQHLGSTIIPKSVEIDCTGRNNGVPGNTNNGSTIHEGGVAVRVNCAYYNNGGRNIHDIDNSTLSWNLGCNSHDSDGGVGYNLNYGCGGAAGQSTKMWLDGCTSSNSTNDIEALAGTNVYIRDFTGDSTNIGAGTISSY